jgi:hypothetical protein
VEWCVVYAMAVRGIVLDMSVSVVRGIHAGRQRGGGLAVPRNNGRLTFFSRGLKCYYTLFFAS